MTDTGSSTFISAVHEADRLIALHGEEHPAAVAAMRNALLLVPKGALEGFPPEARQRVQFLQARRALDEAIATYGMESEQATEAMVLCMEYAPPEYHEAAQKAFREMFDVPAATHCNEEGQPLYRLEDVAAMLGISMQEAEAELRKMMERRQAMGLDCDGIITDPARVHPIQ